MILFAVFSVSSCMKFHRRHFADIPSRFHDLHATLATPKTGILLTTILFCLAGAFEDDDAACINSHVSGPQAGMTLFMPSATRSVPLASPEKMAKKKTGQEA